MTDAAFLFRCLEDFKWHGQAEILARSMKERGHGLTVHSRAADLRKRGCVIECELRRNGHGRALSYYRLVALGEPEGTTEIGLSAGTSGSPSVPAAATAPLAEHSRGTTSPPDGEQAGTLFACDVDESAGLRGAYWDDAA